MLDNMALVQIDIEFTEIELLRVEAMVDLHDVNSEDGDQHHEQVGSSLDAYLVKLRRRHPVLVTWTSGPNMQMDGRVKSTSSKGIRGILMQVV